MRQCPLLTQSGHRPKVGECPAFDPKQIFMPLLYRRIASPLESLCRHSDLSDAIEKSRSRENGDWSCVPLHKSDRLVSTGCCRKKRCPLLCCFAASCSQAPRLMCSSSFSAAKVCDRNQWRMPFSAYVKASL